MNGLTSNPRRLRFAVFILGFFSLAICSCVERTLTINTEPQGATVVLNDQEVGKSPVRVPFTWYGDYDIIVRKEGHKTLLTNRRVEAPWYQWPVLDLFAECLVPFTIRDERTLDTLVLEPTVQPNKEDLLNRADEMKAQANVEQ
ncbi:MAG: PEGA domain-containing protein [Planctomycetes bacterium]|nr:PEGA domain-containing protein [Planctomycetota bacterium]